MLDAARLGELLRTRWVGRNLLCLHETGSTMDCAKELATRWGCPAGTLVHADVQTHGRGRQQGRSWISSPGANLCFSLIIRPSTIWDALKLNLGAAIAVAQACRDLGVNSAGVKWPNDVWVDGRKVAGMLMDSTTGAAILGIGVNVNEDMSLSILPHLAQSSCSLKQLIGARVDREELLASICCKLEKINDDMLLEQVIEDFELYDVLLDREIVVLPSKLEAPSSTRFTAIARGLSNDGRLRIETPDGKTTLLSAEEVSIRLFLERLDVPKSDGI